jgi:hypothetical protein
MKQFKSFLEAASYHPNCIFCQKTLTIVGRDLVDTDDHDDNSISFYLSSLVNDIITFNKYTEKVSHISPEYNTGHGVFIHGLTFHCDACCQFAYNIQIHIDTELLKLIGIYLNSESLSIEDGADLHEIKNIYSFNRTEYSYFRGILAADADVPDQNSINLPLVPLNLNNPIETVNRIRNLIIFI